ncbi:glycosyl hydrolase [Tenuifilaceae bacterium CYCD]|nr:glycosyl hydrolase [Tenuifilaceae bacterium CYCD]
MKKRDWLLVILAFIAITMCSCTSKHGEYDNEIDRKVDSLLSLMTLDEKIGQLTLYASDINPTGPQKTTFCENEISNGRVGGVFNVLGTENAYKLQQMAVTNTRLRIPLIFGYDIIHGFKTIFPIPFAEACTWNPELIKKSASLAAKEASAWGLNWTFNPMVDITRDPRWGRVSEGSGEDPFLASLIAKAKVQGYQGKNLNNPSTIAACVKHFAAYGVPYGGRDYNTVDISDRTLKEIYLPPFKAAVDAGAISVMSSFNELDAVPCTANKYLLTQILKNEWNFKGFVVSDWQSVSELTAHGVAKGDQQATELAINAGLDMDMQSGCYAKYLKKLVTDHQIDEELVNNAVRRILRAKYLLGLFDNPFLYIDNKRQNEITQSDEIMDFSLLEAKRSIVLLKNENYNNCKILPFNKNVKSIALIGPLCNSRINMLGSWHGKGDTSNVKTIVESLSEKLPNTKIEYTQGAPFTGNNKSGFSKAIQSAQKSDIVICVIGENNALSGEAASRSNIDIPGVQLDLLKELAKTGKPIAAIVMAGRPLILEWLQSNIPSIIFTGQLGTRCGDAIADVLMGEYNPSGKLVMSFPRNVGQIPIFYNHKNTGRPFDANDPYTSKYLDVSNEPLYPFGYGLSYTSFSYTDLVLDEQSITSTDTLRITFTLKNTGNFDGEETCQLYVRDMVASVTRPVKELKAFKKVYLKKGAQASVSFTLTANDLKFYNKDMIYHYEPGEFTVFVGGDSRDLIEKKFELQ